MKDIFEELNSNQKKAVIATEGRIKVNAGAGSGKTKTLAYRYAYLVNELGIDPAHILCLTFTNKAAKEMTQRIAKLVSVGHINDYVNTIHGFCVKVLRREIYRLGFPKSFSILDEDDQKMLVKEVMKELNINRDNCTVKTFLRNIAIIKADTPYIDRFFLPSPIIDKEKEKAIPESMILYLHKQAIYYSLDFDDLIYFTLYIFNHYDDARLYWQKEVNYMMVDETQDCNRSDWKLINIISEGYHNLFIVGDADQAIYEWRGAKPDYFVGFKADKDITLDENYRSTPNILDTANSIIINNKMRLPKNLFTKKDTGTKVIHFHGKDEKEEAKWIKKQIQQLVEKGAKYSDFSILYRASYLSRSIEESLISSQIKYVIWGGTRFFERKEIKNALSYLRLVDHDDDLSFLRIVNVPSRKIGKVYISKLQGIAESEHTTLYAAMKNHIQEVDFNKPTAINFINAIEACRNSTSEDNIVDILNDILRRSGYLDSIRLDGDEERLENIEELINSIKYYQEVNKEEEIGLNTYLQDIALFTNADYKKDSDSIKLMTIHQAKGLEFPYVFVIGLTEGIFPSYRTIRERKLAGLEEERRLMYVAVTRAEKALFLTESEGYNYTSHQDKYPSRFLAEIKRNLFVTEGRMDENLWKGSKDMAKALKEELEIPQNNSIPLHEGDQVKHKVFGSGIIVHFDSEKDSCTVQFGKTTRFVRPAFLQRVDVDVIENKKNPSSTKPVVVTKTTTSNFKINNNDKNTQHTVIENKKDSETSTLSTTQIIDKRKSSYVWLYFIGTLVGLLLGIFITSLFGITWNSLEFPVILITGLGIGLLISFIIRLKIKRRNV